MRMSGVLFGVAVGATLMYLFDPRQGVERREKWGERVRKSRDQAQSAVETGRTRVYEYRHRHDGRAQRRVAFQAPQQSVALAHGCGKEQSLAHHPRTSPHRPHPTRSVVAACAEKSPGPSREDRQRARGCASR